MSHPLTIVKKLQAVAEYAKKSRSAQYECFGSSDDLAEVQRLIGVLSLLNELERKLKVE
ncbi:hypothetical protein [Endozoicomonas sp. ONNA1]|uniref:hypothetical protein n=1 Tax=Endozoicomonas sp. ONNA1 TaxID=2828740 RepID=UPI0021497179|nr:hypothetical protein [Endozoicomonas sp. ONNA1]